MAPREQPSFDPNKYLDGPEYGTMGKHKLTSKEVKEIADARIAKAERDAEEAKSKAADQASAVAGLENFRVNNNVSTRADVPQITGDTIITPPKTNIADFPLPDRVVSFGNMAPRNVDDRTGSFPDAQAILTMAPTELEKMFESILMKVKPGGKFSFANIDNKTLQALQAIYHNGKIPTGSVSGSEYAHGLANAIILSGEIGSNKSLITNHFDLQEGYRVAIQQATSPMDLRTRLTELNDGWGKLREYGRVKGEEKVATLANIGITPDNGKIIEGAGYKIIQEGETVMITGEKKGNVSINYVLSPDYPISDVKIEGRSLVITYLQGMKPQILPIQGEGRITPVQSGNENLATLEGKTNELSRAVNGLNASTGLIYRRLGSRIDNGGELLQKFLTDPQFSPARDSIANDIIARAKIKTGGFLGFGKKPSFPDIADKGKGDVVLKGVGSYPKIENGMEFEVAEKTYVIGNSRDRTEGVVLLSKEQASKSNLQPLRYN